MTTIFPNNPQLNDIFVTSASVSYKWNGEAWQYSPTYNYITICTSATRPSSPIEGTVIYQTDTDSLYTYNGSTWIAVGGAAQYTNTDPTIANPSLTAGTIWINSDTKKLKVYNGSSFIDPEFDNYLSLVSASNTYLSISSANNLYLTKTSASTQYEKSIPYSASTPSGSTIGDMWLDSSSTSPILKVYNGSTWIAISGSSEAAFHPFFQAGM